MIFVDSLHEVLSGVQTPVWLDELFLCLICSSAVQPVKFNRAFHRCNYCFKTFTKAESFKVHSEEHALEHNGPIVLFDCKICSMQFCSDAEFQDHMNIHNGRRPYKCFVCEKEFCIAEHLQDHVRLHTDVAAPHLRCGECGDRFLKPDDLVRHKGVHQSKS